MSSGEAKDLISLFDKELLVSSDDVQCALLKCGNALTEQNIEPLLRELASWSLSDRPLLELILSGMFRRSPSIPQFSLIGPG